MSDFTGNKSPTEVSYKLAPNFSMGPLNKEWLSRFEDSSSMRKLSLNSSIVKG